MADFDNLPLVALTLCLLPLIFLLGFRRKKQAPTRNPTPQSYPIIGNLPGLIRNRHRFHDWVTDMLSQTPSFTIQVNSFLNLSNGVGTANPINVHHLLVANFQNYVKGSRFQDHLHELLGHGIFAIDGHLWTFQRKISSHEFNTKSLKHFISDVVTSQLTDNLVPCLTRACNENQTVDLQEILQRFTFNNICRVAFGVDVSDTTNSAFTKAFDDAVEISSSRFFNPVPAIWKIQRFLNIGSEKKLKEAIKTVNDFALGIIKSKEEHEHNSGIDSRNQDLLSRFMSSGLEFDDQEQKRKFLRDIVISFILAGKDSTSTALTWFFWLINGHPCCKRLILDEIDALDYYSFDYDDLKKLNYLHAALSESLRLFPPIPINSRLTVDDDVWPDGTHVSKGWFADYSSYAMGRMERVWGPDCREFKPERWLDHDDDGGVFKPSDPFKFPVFHCGPRMCLGKDMAFVQMKTIVVGLMREFEIVAVECASAGKMMDPPYTLSLVLKMRGGFHVTLKRRK